MRILYKAIIMFIQKYKVYLIAFSAFSILAVLVAGRGLFTGKIFHSGDIAFNRIWFEEQGGSYNHILSDSPFVHYPNYYYFWESLKNGNWPEYRPHTFLGTAYGWFDVGQFLLNWPMLFFDISTGLALSTVFMLTLCGYFMFLLLRYFKVRPELAFLGGIVWMLNSHQIAWLQFPQHLATQLWIPLLFLVYTKLLRKLSVQNAILVILTLFLTLTSGYTQVTVYALLALAFYSLVFIIRDFYKKAPLKEVILKAGVVMTVTVVGAFLNLGMILNMMGGIDSGLRGSQSSRLPTNCQVCSLNGAFYNLSGFVSPDALGNGFEYPYGGSGNIVEDSKYAGIFILLSVLLIPFVKKKRFSAWLFGGLSLLFFLLMYGISPFVDLFSLIPYVSFGGATRMITIVLFALTVSTVIALEDFLSRKFLPKSVARFSLLGGILSFLAILFSIQPQVFERVLSFIPSLPFKSTIKEYVSLYPYTLYIRNVIFILIGCSLFFFLFYLKSKSTKNINILLGIIIIFTILDLGRFSFFFNTYSETRFDFPKSSWVETIIADDSEPFRIHIRKPGVAFLPSNTNVVYGIEEIGGYGTNVSLEYVDLYKSSFEETSLTSNGILYSNDLESPIFNLLNVKYVVSHLYKEPSQNLEVIYKDKYITIYENKEFLQRIFSTDEYQVVEESDLISTYLVDKNFDPTEIVYLEENPGIFDTVSVEPATISDIAVNVESVEALINDPDGGWIVFSQMFDSNWRAFVDGEEQEIYKADSVLMSIFVEPGEHEVTFEYEDPLRKAVSRIQIVVFTFVFGLSLYKVFMNHDGSWLTIAIISLLILFPLFLFNLADKDIPLKEIAKYEWGMN